MVNKNRLAVAIAVYNGEYFLGEQIESIINQKTNVDLYISIDFSSDNSLLICQRFADMYPNVFLLPYGVRYGSAGQNFFRLLVDVDFSSYDYVAFADQDDVWFDFKLERAVEQLSVNKADGYSSNVTAFWPDGKQKLVKKDYPQTDFDYIFESAGPGCTFVMTQKLTLAIKNSLITKKDGIRKIWLHDWYCYAFARSKGFKWLIDSMPTMAYRQHGGNEVGANSGWKSFKSRAVSILSGDGILKALNQASFLGLDDLQPVTMLCAGKRSALFKLALFAHRCRRKPLDKLMFFLIFCWFAIRGLPLDES